MGIDLEGRIFFEPRRLPICVVRVATGGPHELAHPHDATEIEHAHDFHELVVILRGNGMHRIDGVDYPVRAGDVFLLQGRQRHYFHDRRGMVLMNVMFDPARLSLPMPQLRAIPGYQALFVLEPGCRRSHRFASRLHLSPPALKSVARLLAGMYREFQRQEPGYEAALLARLVDLLVMLSRHYSRNAAPEARSLLRIGELLSRLDREEEAPGDLAALAAQAGFSVSHFMRVFKRAAGSPPMRYARRQRLDAAARLLRETDWPVTRVARESGFPDANYFARLFRRTFGQTPGDCRRATDPATRRQSCAKHY